MTADSLEFVKIKRYMIKQRVFIADQNFKNNESLVTTVYKFSTKYGQNSDLTSSSVKRVTGKLKQTGSVC